MGVENIVFPTAFIFFNLNVIVIVIVIVIFIEKNINITLDFTNASCSFETFSKFLS